MIVSNICTDSFPSGRVKLPQIQHAARPPRLSHRKTVSYHRVIEYWCILKQLVSGLDPSFVLFLLPLRRFNPNTTIQIVATLLHSGLFGTLSVQLCASAPFLVAI